jgi:hypothetical protein
MKSLFLLIALLTAQNSIPKNDPNGVWESSSGTQYELKLSGSDLTVRLVPGSNKRYVAYEVDLKVHPEEHNTYIGKGFLVAIVAEGKQCRFETDWQLTVIQKDRILGGTTNIVPDAETCQVKEKTTVQLDLKRK